MTRFTRVIALTVCLLPLSQVAAQYGGQGGYGMMSGGSGNQAGMEMPHNPKNAMSGLGVFLTATGVRNQEGQVVWPLGLRLLRADQLREQLEAQLQLAAGQAVGGTVNPRLLDEIQRNVERFQRLLLADKKWRFSMPLAVYEDAERFLQELGRNVQVLQASSREWAREVPGKAELKAGQMGLIAPVSIQDDLFEPATLTIRKGTTVRWTNRGTHPHTVTSDTGGWDTGAIKPGGVSEQTFSAVGTYPYHCAIHPGKMRGVVVVVE